MRMWLAEIAVFLAAAAAVFLGCARLLTLHGPVALGGGASLLVIGISVLAGSAASNRFRAWGLRRRGK